MAQSSDSHCSVLSGLRVAMVRSGPLGRHWPMTPLLTLLFENFTIDTVTKVPIPPAELYLPGRRSGFEKFMLLKSLKRAQGEKEWP